MGSRSLRIEPLENRRLLALTQPVEPAGSLAYSHQVTDAIAVAGEVDALTVNLDAGQTLSVAVDPDSTLTAAVEVLDPGSALLASGQSSLAGDGVLLQTFSVTTAGAYTIRVRGAGSTVGNYDLSLTLNSAVEAESVEGSPNNDSVVAAQDIDGSFLGVGSGGAERGAVIGQGDGGPDFVGSLTQVNNVYSPNVLTFDFTGAPLPQGDATLTITAIADLDTSTEFLTLNAEGVFSQNLFVSGGQQQSQVSTQITIPQATLSQLAADGKITFTITPSASVNNLGNNQLKLDLQYPAGSGTSDWFSFTLQDGQSTSLMIGGAGVPFGALELYDANGTTLLTSSVTTSNVYQAISNIVDVSTDGSPNRYYARVTGVNGQYNLVAMRDADFDTEDNSFFALAQDITLSGAVLGNVSLLDHDHFRISVNAGDALQIRTATPGDQPFEFENLLDVGIAIFDPTGAPIPYASGPGNESFSHLATLTGDYTIHVFAENSTLDGTYVLEVSGHTGTLAPLIVASTSPPNGGTVANAAPLTQFLVNLSSDVHPGSVDAADLLIDGNPALGVTIVDEDTLAFDLPVLGDGLHTVSLAAGALANLQAGPLAAYSGSFTLDNAGPRVVSSSIQDGDVISSTGPFVYVVKFDEPLLAAGLGAEDVALVGAASGTVAPTSFSYDGGTSTLTVQFPQLVEDSYTLTLLSGGGGFNDTAGNDLDGELLTSPIGPNASGDGIAGGNFVLHFGSDDLAVDPFPVPLSALEPLGSLIYAGSVNDAIAFRGDQDEFSLDLEAGQVVSIVVQGSGGLTPQVVLEAPDLQTTTATAAGPNGAAVLQAIPTALTGAYKIRVAGIGGTFGGYSVRVILNSALEAEAHGGPSNDDVLSAQNLDSSFVGLGIGSAARGAVVGTGAGGSADFYKFSLAPNQSASLALSSQTSGGEILELRDAAGNLLAAGSNAANYTRTINNFVAATGGVYYVSVVGATSEYRLLVTRNADVDAEPNNDFGLGAQDVTLNGTALGAVVNGVVPPSGGGTPVSGPINVNGSPLSLGFAVDGSFVGSTIGAIHNGIEYFRHGTYLATYTVAFNGATYTNAAPSNSSAFAVLLEDLSSGSQHVIRATGSIIPNVRFERIVSWKNGDDHAVIFTKITNDTGAPLNNVAVLENIDPDPGGIYDTSNDVTAAGQLVVGSNGAGAMALGSTDPRAVLSAEDFFITDPFAVINSPSDPNGTSADIAINLGFNIGTLAPGATETMAAVMIFGANKAAVENTFANVASTTTTGDVDAYSFQANAGDVLTLATNRPAAGPGEFVNNLDLAIELYDPLGNLVASDSTGALTHLAALSGAYTVRVLAENNSEGEYVLNVSGHTGALAPFEVTTSSLADGDHVLVAPTEVTLEFSDSILLSSVDAADLSVNGVAAANVVVVGGNALRFTLPPAVEGPNNVVIAGGALTDLQGQPLEPFSITYDLDLTAPRVIASSLLEGGSISNGALVYTAQFDDPLAAAFLDASDVQLLGQFSGPYAPTAFSYDPATLTLTVEYSGLSEDLYTLTLLSGAGRFVDQFGRGLDGEPAAVGTVPSGDGVPGGNFVVHFAYDDSTAQPLSTPLSPVQPLGSAVYTGEVDDTIQFAGDQDRFSVSLEKNQTISIAVRGSGGLVPRVSLLTPGSPLVAAAVAAGPNGAAVLQSIPTTATGSYIILVEGAAGSAGNYEITIMLNAGLELENFDVSDNGLQIDAQSLDPAFQNRGTIGAAVAAVAGRGDLLSGPVYSDSQTQNNVVFQPNVLTYNFASAPAPIGDAVLTVTAYADLDLTSEYLRLAAEGFLLQDLFVTGGSQSTQVTTQVTIPLATLALLAADGTISFTVTPSPSVGNVSGNFLTLGLEYLTGSSVGGDWYEFSLEDGETASLALDAPNGTVLELFDAAGNVLATGVETVNLTQAISNFADQTSDGLAETYYARITVGAGPYNLVVTRNSDFDAEPNQNFDNAQDIGGVSGASGHIIASPPGSTPLGPLASAFGSGAIPILQSFAGPGYSNGVPPDPTLAAGPEQVVAIVNTSIGIYDKSTGSQLLLQSLNGSSGFFGSVGATTTVFDPWVLYDTESERFFAIAIDIASSSSSFLYIAVSTDSTPVSGSDWHKYRIPYTHTPTAALGSGVHFADYPKLGVNDDAIWISGNYFPISSGSGVYAGITAIEKNALLSGGSANILYQEFFNGFSVMPMTQYDSGSTQYFAEAATDGGNSIRIHAVSNALTTPTRTIAIVAVPSFLASNDVPQLGGGAPADSIDARIMTGVWRDGSMWFAHAIIDPAVDSEAVVRWYEVATNGFPAGGSPTLLQSGNIDPGPGVHTWMPALSVDGNGNMAAGFSVGGPNQYFGAGFTGRLAGDAAGTTVLPITEYATGLGAYQIIDSVGRNRWGDYSGLAIDPTNNGTFWVFNEYPTATNTWATQIASFQLQQEVDEDWYQFGVNAGDILRIQTSTPGGGGGEPENLLDPSIQLLDPSGNVVASASHVGNELLFHVALATGQYRVRVFSETTGGEYFLQVEGATGGSLAPAVVDVDPDFNSKINAFPLTYTLTLSEATLPSSLQASDLLIGGLPAIALNVIDAKTLEFTIDPNANVGSGVYQVALVAGAVQDLQGSGNAAFVTTFEVDVTPPVIIDTLWNGSPLKVSRLYNEGSLTFQALFSEDLFLAGSARRGTFTPGTDDVFVTNAQTGTIVYPLTVAYDPATDLLTAEFGMLLEGDYTLTIRSGSGSVEDQVGNDLDGDPLGAGLDGTTTGNGIAGGNYTVAFSMDRTSPAPLNPFVAVEPLGGLIASSQNNAGFINTAGDQEVFEYIFEAGQLLSAILRPANPLASLTVQLVGVTSIYAAAAPGQAVVLPLTALAASGLYELRVSGDAKGAFSLDVVMNAAIEPGSDSANGQELAIDNSLIDFGSGRYAVLGRSTATPPVGSIVANGSFETGNFSGWTVSTAPRGASPLRNWTVSTAGNGINSYGLASTAPQDGSFVAWNGFDGSALMEYLMSQDVTLPAGPGPLLLSWQDRVQWNFTAASSPALQPRLYEVQIRNPTTNAVLATLHSFSTDVETVNPTGDTGWQTHSASLAAFAGQTVRLYFVEKIPESSTGPGQFEIDNVSITSPDVGGPDADEYTLDLSGKAGNQLDVVLAGLDGADFSGQLLELLDDAGNVLATASAAPLGPGVNVTNFDLGIRDFVIPNIGSNVYTLRLHSAVPGKYSFVVTEDLIFDTEPNQNPTGPLRSLDQAGALGYLSAETSLAAGQIEPDDYANGTVLNTIVPGVTLTVNGSPTSNVTATTSPYTPPGARGFGANGSTGWSSGTQLHASFAVLTNQVSITVGSDDGSDVSFLSAYDSSGNLLGTVTSASLSTGQTQVLAINRPTADIASVRAGGVGGDVTYLDRLQFNAASSANTGDAYQISLLVGQSVTISTDTPLDGAHDLPGNSLDPKLTLLDAAGQVLIADANSRDGKNAELTFTASIAGTYVVRVGQETGDGAYVLRAVKGLAGADFDQNGSVDGGDFLAWQRGFGIVAPNAIKTDGDANNDANVDGNDLALWKDQYGTAPAALPTAVAAFTASALLVEELPAADVAAESSIAYRAAIDAAMAMSLLAEQVADGADVAVESVSLLEQVGRYDVDLAVDDALPWRSGLVGAPFVLEALLEAENDAHDIELQWLTDELLEQVFG